MSDYLEQFQRGYSEGILIGRTKCALGFFNRLKSMNVCENYEEIMRFFDWPENICARLMDYIPVNERQWSVLTDEEWESKRHLFSEKLFKAMEERKTKAGRKGEAEVSHT